MGRTVTIRQLVDGGAVRMVCQYHSSFSGSDPKWIATADFARREFRAASPATIKQLIARCKKARSAVAHLNWSYRKDAAINGGRKPKPAKGKGK